MNRQRRFSAFASKILFSLAALPFIASATPARAEEGRRGAGKTHIAVDFDFNTPIDAPSVDAGGGGALRLGQKFDLLLISLTPELGGGYHAFDAGDVKLYSGFLGGRLGVGKIIEPSVYGHLGLAKLSGVESRTSPIMDAGLALDLTLLPLIDLGVHAGYNVLLPRDDGSAFKFVTLGAQAALVF